MRLRCASAISVIRAANALLILLLILDLDGSSRYTEIPNANRPSRR